MRARGLHDPARVFLLDLLSLSRVAGGAPGALTAAVQNALRAWPGLLSGADPLAMSAAVIVMYIVRDEPAGSLSLLEPDLAKATLADAKQRALDWLSRCSTEEADRDEVHCAVRGLELLASHCGA